MSWNDERIETLKTLWANGLSASQIANELGGVTRNSVIGKVHRLGLSGRRVRQRKDCNVYRPKPKKPRVARQPQRPTGLALIRGKILSGPQPPTPIPNVDETTLVSWDQLEDHHCRWIPNEPAGIHTRYCGRHKVEGLSYCEHHALRSAAAWQPHSPSTPVYVFPKMRGLVKTDAQAMAEVEEFVSS